MQKKKNVQNLEKGRNTLKSQEYCERINVDKILSEKLNRNCTI